MKAMNSDEIARDIFQQNIRKGLIGPGSDIFIYQQDEKDEIISDYPLNRYYSGVLFPIREKINSFSEGDDRAIENETTEDEEELAQTGLNNKIASEENQENDKVEQDNADEEEIKTNQSIFFPSNIGLTFCVDSSLKTLNVEFRYGIYDLIPENQAKIKVDLKAFNEFVSEQSIFPFKDILKYEDGYMYLTRNLNGHRGGRGQTRSGEYKIFDDFKNCDELKDRPSLKSQLYLFENLIGRVWKREQINVPLKINLEEIPENEIIPLSDDRILRKSKEKDHILRIGYSIRTYEVEKNPKSRYVKILLVNNSSSQAANKYSNKNELLNRKCIFQVEIVVEVGLKPYKNYSDITPIDEEAKILNYQYKDSLSFGIGHNCSVIWDNQDKNNPKYIQTTFLPEFDAYDIKNNFTELDFDNPLDFKTLNECLDIYDLSIFGNEKNVVVKQLMQFVNLYGNWITKQTQEIKTLNEIENDIINNLKKNYDRILSNIHFLEKDKVFKAFQLANTAMLIQIIISNDEAFAGKEKELSSVASYLHTTAYDSIDFFRNYDFQRIKSKIKTGRPKYRPFQLAFLLLSLDGIIDKARNEIVDLIWFPTGGGKTEAYLAVAALTIIWRRMNNQIGFEGTSVIMRYTLRLLTAQQFERASRLIVSLEFLRNFYKQELNEKEPISIGLWVGMSSTPNTVVDAFNKVDEINNEFKPDGEKQKKGTKIVKGNPEEKNVFQISSCPWCGTKLITKDEYNEWKCAFKCDKRDNYFKIECNNPKCFCHNQLPIQVIDEMLYQKPPTLLFATVDKFAMLAWQGEGHRFFNSLTEDGLPPDLIIQDELHLLNGPLGSITGLFESVIELLCTKGNRKPKIIASTATTRNTKLQIKALYNRTVNIFPPPGLSYKDSFFSKISEVQGNRRYIGFMPTGKSGIDTQLQILGHFIASRIELYKAFRKSDYSYIDKFWTIVSYYNSLKDVGKIYNKVGDEISNFASTIQIRLNGENPSYTFNYYGLPSRVVELTSRIESPKIKQTLKELEENSFQEGSVKEKFSDKIDKFGNTFQTKYTIIKDVIDLVLATNMLSVGIDIKRLNIMLINGQPKNIAEYIQASSRVGRHSKGLVLDILDATRSRDKSYFEHFIPFHQAFYKFVEPITVTPFTENTINKMLTSLIITFVRHKFAEMNRNDEAKNFESDSLRNLAEFIESRFSGYNDEYLFFKANLEELVKDWIDKKSKEIECYKTDRNKIGLLLTPAEKVKSFDEKWLTMQSMREIDTNAFILINPVELGKNPYNGNR